MPSDPRRPPQPNTPDGLAEVLGALGRATPSETLWTLDRKTTAPLLLATPPDGRPAPLWAWLQAAMRRSILWTPDDAALLGEWTGCRKGGWWLRQTAAGGRAFADAWLHLVADRDLRQEPGVVDLIRTIPPAWMATLHASRHALGFLSSEYKKVVAGSPLPPSPASLAILAAGADPFAEAEGYDRLSHPGHLAKALESDAARFEAWAATPDHFDRLLHDLPRDSAIRQDLLAWSARRRAWRASDPVAAEQALDAVLSLHPPHPPLMRSVRADMARARPSFALADRAGRTLLMLALTEASVHRGHTMLAALGPAMRIRANRAAVRGRDAAGRTLWPYLLRACPLKGVNAAVSLARAIEEKEGLPGPDANGHALLHQVFNPLDASGQMRPAPPAGWDSPWAHGRLRMTRLFRTGADPQVWLGTDDDLAHDLLGLLKDPSSRRPTASFLAALLANLAPSAPALPRPWQELFLSAAILYASQGTASAISVEPPSLDLVRPWLLPSVAPPPWVVEQVMEEQTRHRALFKGLFDEVALLGRLGAVAQSLSVTPTPPPRPPRRRA